MAEVITMADWEIDRLHVIKQVLERRLTWSQAAEQLRLTRRQIGRLCARVRSLGSRGIVHGLRGQPSNRRLSDTLLGKAASALHDPLWEGFRPHFCQEKLLEYHGLKMGAETVRKLMMSTGIWIQRSERPKHRKWRQRRESVGMLVQVDGSHHDWFEGRAPRCVLMAYIDDAGSEMKYAEFVDSEDTVNVMRTTKAYIESYGRPLALYVDKDSIYRTNRQASIEEDLRKQQPITQFKRALDELGIELICAHSPQAKGRVERSFKTQQDRLIKELRLAGISDMKSANAFLLEKYLPAYNKRYGVSAASSSDAHRPLLPSQDLERILAIRQERTVLNDYTVQYKQRWLQLLVAKELRLRPKERVTLEQRLDGSLHVRWREMCLEYKLLDKRPYAPKYAFQSQFPTRSDVWQKPKTKAELPPEQKRILGIGGYRRKSNYEYPATEIPAPAFI